MRVSKKTLRRRRALERLNKDVERYTAANNADKLEKAQTARAFLLTKPGVG